MKRPEPQRPPSRSAPWLLAALLLLVAWEVGATVYQHLAAPTEAHYAALAEELRKQRRADEPVLFAPTWIEPLGRLHSDLPLELQLLSDVDRYARVWEISTRGARHVWLKGAPAPTQRLRFGPLTLAAYDKPPARVRYSFAENLPRARVDRIANDDRVDCRYHAGTRRFSCDATRGWNWVGMYMAEVGHRPYRCIYAHPVEGHRMRISFPSALLGRSLVIYTGIDDFENRKRAKAPVLLQVFVGPELVGTIRHENDWPWRRHELDTSARAGLHAVRFEISAPNAYARTFCFLAEARD